MKPVALIENALLNSTEANNIVVDLFGGSGSTLIACEKLNRKCYMMEIDPIYCDVILDRWSSFTNKDPIREDGKKWSEIKKNG
jgi:DNA modification methylase